MIVTMLVDFKKKIRFQDFSFSSWLLEDQMQQMTLLSTPPSGLHLIFPHAMQ